MTALFDPKSIIRPTSIKPYPHQEAGVRAIVAEYKRGVKSTLACLPVGTGKGNILAWVSKWVVSKGGRSLTLAHTKDIVRQNAAYHEELGVPTRIEMGDNDARSICNTSWLPDVWAEPFEQTDQPVSVSATVQTMQGQRLDSWPSDYFRHINIDEGHHATCDTFRKVISHFSGATVLLVTATPDRADGQGLGMVAETIAYKYPMRTAIEDGWLCRPKFHRCEVQIDLRKFTKRSMSDYSDSDIAEAIKPHIQVIANAIRKEIEDRPTIVFCPDIITSGWMADALNSIKIRAEMVCGKSENRDELISAYKQGEFQVLCNAMLLTEGFDAPKTAAVVICRPTMSRGLYNQMVGRGMRRGKEDCRIIDMTWVTGDRDGLPAPDKLLVCPTELFDTYDTPEEVNGIAKEILEKGETDDIMEAVTRAEEVYQERVRIRIKVREQQVRYKRVVYDPFSVMESIGLPIRNEAQSSEIIRPTQKQIDTLKKFGVEGSEHMSRRRANVILDRLIDRSKKKLATHKQLGHIIGMGCDPKVAREMSLKEATEFLNERWGERKPRRKSNGRQRNKPFDF